MSHYSFHKKVLLEDENKNLFFLAQYSDSSITTFSRSRNGRRYEFHPKNWCIINPTGKGIILTYDELKRESNIIISREMENLENYRRRFEPTEPPKTLESRCYAGTIYPNGGLVKHMKSFYSCRKTKNADEWLKNNTLQLYIYLYDNKTYETKIEFTVDVKNMSDILNTNKKILDLLEEYKNCSFASEVNHLFISTL